MADKQSIARLVDYCDWANRRCLDAAAGLAAEDYARDLKGSHGGVHGTLVHTFGAEYVWHRRFLGDSPPALPGHDQLTGLAALRERWAALEAERRAWLAALPADAGESVIAYRNFKGEAFSSRLWPLVQHVANHGSYHRGQVAVFLRQLGAKPPATDLVAFDRERG